MTLKDLEEKEDIESIYILARYCYRIGEPILEDGEYDIIERYLRAHPTAKIKAYLERTYDDDPVPVELLKAMDMEPLEFVNVADKSNLNAILDEEKSNSIESCVKYEEAFEYFKMLRSNKLDFVASLKMDGVNTKMLFSNDIFSLALSRGRSERDSFDYTKGVARVIPHKLESDIEYLKVTGESFVVEEALPLLRQKYDEKKYKTSKSSAMSMLRVQHASEDYKYLKTVVFSAEGLADTLHDMFDKLEDAGFSTAPHISFSWEDIPEDFDTFCKWLDDNIFDPIHELGLGMPSDGVVIEVDDLLWIGEQKNQYSTRQKALKFSYWAFHCEYGIITDIEIAQQRVYKSVKVKIQPMTTYDGCEARVINTFNPGILIKNDLFIGQKVYFERNSGAVNILVHGARLDAQLSGD